MPRALISAALSLVMVGCSPSAFSDPAASIGSARPAQSVAPTTPPSPAAAEPMRLTGIAKRLDAGAYVYDLSMPHVTLEVPPNWMLSEAMPRHFGLHRDDVLVDESVRVWFDMRIASSIPPALRRPRSGSATRPKTS